MLGGTADVTIALAKALRPGVSLLKSHRPIGLHALFKPTNCLSHPNNNGLDTRTGIIAGVYSQSRESYQLPSSADEPTIEIWLLHRLDTCTSGILLVADNERTADYIKRLFRERNVKKKYVAAVFGKPKRSNLSWKDLVTVSKDGSKALSRISSSSSSSSLSTSSSSSSSSSSIRRVVGAERVAVTNVTLRQWNSEANISLLELRPLTGVTHQLRVQCQWHNLPIIGDRIYGSYSLNKTVSSFDGKKNYMYLHAAEISLLVPEQKITSNYCDRSEGGSQDSQSMTMFNVKVDIPDTFKELFSALR